MYPHSARSLTRSHAVHKPSSALRTQSKHVRPSPNLPLDEETSNCEDHDETSAGSGSTQQPVQQRSGDSGKTLLRGSTLSSRPRPIHLLPLFRPISIRCHAPLRWEWVLVEGWWRVTRVVGGAPQLFHPAITRKLKAQHHRMGAERIGRPRQWLKSCCACGVLPSSTSRRRRR